MQRLKEKYKTSKYKLGIFLTVFALIFTSKETLVFGTNADEKVKMIGYVVPLIFLFLWGGQWWLKFKKYSTKKEMAILIMVCFLVGMTAITNFEFSVKYGYEILLLLLGFVLVQCIDVKDVIDAFIKVMLILSIISLVVFVIGYLDTSKFEIFSTINNTSDMKFYNLIVAVYFYSDPYGALRNYSIFREPGVFALFLILALILEMKKSKDLKPYRLMLLCTAIISTFSTAGIIVLAIALVAFFLTNLKVKELNEKKLMLVAYFLILLTFFVTFLDYGKFVRMLFDKLFNGSGSTGSRTDSFILNCMLIAKRPFSIIFGGGFKYVEEEFTVISELYSGAGIHNTNTLFKMYAIHGLPYGAFIGFFSIIFLTKKSNFKFDNLVYVLCVFLMTCNEEIIMNVLIYYLLFSSIKNVFGVNYESITY